MPDLTPQDEQPDEAIRPPSDPAAQEAPVAGAGPARQVAHEERAFEEIAARNIPTSPAEGRLGPAADPAEGKR